MTESSQLRDTVDRHARWVVMWRAAVSASRLAMGLVELSTSRFVELSQKGAQLLGTTPAGGTGLNFLSVADRASEAAETFRLARDGMLDGARSRRRFHRPDGSMIELESSGWVIRSPAGPPLALWAAREMSSESEHTLVVEQIVGSASCLPGSEVAASRLILDDCWRIAQISTGAKTLLGRSRDDMLGRSVIDLTHPDDVAALLFAFARATTDASARVRVRLRHHEGGWQSTQLVPEVLEGDGTSPFAVEVVADHQADAAHYGGGAGGIATQLRRIADIIEAAAVLAPLVQTADALGASATVELSGRQWEVVARLTRGERVATIAAEMYLSQSTVRNHLTAVYGKFGVHSQAELLARLLNSADRLSR